MNKTLTLLFCTALVASCATLKSIDTNNFAGLYQSDAPCADCRSLKTTINIKPDFSYEKTTLYLGKDNGYFETKGNWKIANDSTIVLNENGNHKQYRIRNNSLLNIDTIGQISGNPIYKVDLSVKAENDFSQQKEKGIHFFATGNEPFWSFELASEKTVVFTLIGNKPISVKDFNTVYKNGVTTIKSKSKKPNLEVTIYDFQCVNDMSGAVSQNYVEVKINNTLYKGCGTPLTKDFKISGKWNLIFIKDFEIQTSATNKKPFINFDIQKKSVNGNFGCNGFGGSYTADNEKISFSQLMGTLMACPALETENKFSAALRSVDSYKIVNNGLQLYKGKELLLSFSR